MSAAPEVTATAGAAPKAKLERNDIVRLFGTPSETVGSVNEPRQQHEHGIQFNEKWIYDRPKGEPSRPKARVIFWQRYDFLGSIRIERDGHLVPESEAELLARLED